MPVPVPSIRRLTPVLAALLVAPLLGAPLVVPPAAAAPTPQSAADGASRWRVVDNDVRQVRKAGSATVGSQLRAARTAVDTSDPVTAPFTINYLPTSSSWTATQKAAFQRAVDVWSRLLVSPVTIEVDATLEALPPGFLGSAGPAGLVQDDVDGTWYPVALGNAIDGTDLNGGVAEIEASFPNNNPDIHYGAGAPPANTYDFTSTVLHELGHGLSFLGSMTHNGTNGFYGVDNFDNPLAFDRFAVHIPASTPVPLLSYPTNSTQLGAALESGQVFWDGGAGKAAAGGVRPQLYAPATWEPGSSYSHLDETAYAAGTLNSLMTPIGDQQEVNAEPGPIALGIFKDQGWALSTAADPPAATKYTPVDPVRVLDTRPAPDNIGVTPGKVAAGTFRDLKVAGTGTSVPADATAVVLNVTGVAPTTGTDVRVYPTGSSAASVPLVSNLNLAAGRTRANLVTVKVGIDGKVRLRNNSGSIHLLADLAGYYTTTGASTYFPVSPSRVLDTRSTTSVGVPPGKVLAADVRDLTVAGVGAVPATATAVVLGVTAVNATQSTDVRVYPTPASGDAVPGASNINVYTGGPTPNLVIVKVGSAGKVRLRNNSGAVDLLADVYGYYESSSGGALFRALSPSRVLDTRPGTVNAGASVDLAMAGAGGVGAGATAVVLNVTGTGATASTDIRVFPAPASGSAVPTVSTLNLVKGQTAADAAIVPVGSGTKVRFYNSSGSVALIADVAGWFGP